MTVTIFTGHVTMQHTALRIIRDEHLALAAMLRSLRLMVKRAHHNGMQPDFGVMRAMLFYVDEFPERLHHPKETDLLCPMLRERCPELLPVLDRLDSDHHRGEQAIRVLEHAMLAYEVLGEPRRAAFEEALGQYVDRYLEHMAVEESQVLPAAQRVLDDAEWSRLDAAFADNRDPATGHAVNDVYRPLFSRIAMLAPAPIGLGAAS
jgi:hemerythrin-like domain-containing protein